MFLSWFFQTWSTAQTRVFHSNAVIIEESPRWLTLQRKHSLLSQPTSCCDSVSVLGGDDAHQAQQRGGEEEEKASGGETSMKRNFSYLFTTVQTKGNMM